MSAASFQRIRLGAAHKATLARLKQLVASSSPSPVPPSASSVPSSTPSPCTAYHDALGALLANEASAVESSSHAASSILGLTPADPVHTRYYDQLRAHGRALDAVVDDVEAMTRLVKELGAHYASVSAKTAEVREECASMLTQQDELLTAAQALRSQLQFFDEADRIEARLDRNEALAAAAASRARNRSEKLVKSDEFSTLLEKLEECVAFMKAHPGYRDSARFLKRFKKLHLRVLNHIKSYFSHELAAAVTAVQSQKSETMSQGVDVLNSAGSARAFVEFRAVAASVRSVIQDVETRAQRSVAYRTLLSQCLQAYYFQRDVLLHDDVKAFIQEKTHGASLPDMTRTACSYLVGICTLEYQLFREFFSPSKLAMGVLHEILSHLCGILYTELRPSIIREMDVDTLCEEVSILRFEILEEQLVPRGEPVAPFADMIRRIVQDVQERLSYRAQIFIRDEIDCFQPAPEDLDYPARLQPKPDEEAADAGEEAVPTDAYASWYPTLESTLLLLSKLYRCLERPVFRFLAQDAVLVCTNSLLHAAKRLKDDMGALDDAQLFLIKHLLILREQISPFEVDFRIVEQQLDLSHMHELLPGLFRAGGNLKNLLHAVESSEPKLLNNESDSKRNLETELKAACEGYISRHTHEIVGPLSEFLQVHSAIAQQAGRAQGDDDDDDDDDEVPVNPRNTDILQDELARLLRPFMEADGDDPTPALERKLRGIRSSMALYLRNPVTEKILFKPIRDNVREVLQQTRLYTERSFVQCDSFITDSLHSLEGLLYSLE